jgi:membrane-associated phospholipid phosphatase
MVQRRPFLRSYEYIVIVYFLYCSVLALVLDLNPAVPKVVIGLNAVIIGGLVFLAYVDSLRRTRLLKIVRDWYAPPLLLLAYREMGWFAQPHVSTALEDSWIVWDRLLLNEWGLRYVIEFLGPVGPGLLEIAYVFVYPMAPFAIAALYLANRLERVEALLFNFMLAVLSVYVLFPFFPSEPPWTIFPGQDFPTYQTIFREFNAWMLGGQGIHTSVFPSAHVAGAMSVAFAMIRLLPETKWVGRGWLVLAILIALATVYCRYHYAADAIAGFAMALLATGVSIWRERAETRAALRY